MKKILSIIMVLMFLLSLSSCGAKENPLVIDGRTDAKNYTIFSPLYTKDHPLSKCFGSGFTVGMSYQNENIDISQTRKITLDKKTYTLTYKESAHFQFYDVDRYYAEDDSFYVSYYSGTTTIANIHSSDLGKEDTIENLFPLETLFSIEPKFETEADYINYARKLAKVLGVDVSNSYTEAYTYTSPNIFNGNGFLTDDQSDEYRVEGHQMQLIKNPKNGVIREKDVFSIFCNYVLNESGENQSRLTNINFPVPFPDEVFEVSEEKMKELIKTIHGEDCSIEIEKSFYRIVFTDLLTLAVAYSYEDESGKKVTLGAYIFPEDTVFPE